MLVLEKMSGSAVRDQGLSVPEGTFVFTNKWRGGVGREVVEARGESLSLERDRVESDEEGEEEGERETLGMVVE